MTGKRLDTQVPAEGAECLAQGMLCRAVIPTFKAPTFRASYDLVAINPYNKKSATIQVKSRFQTDCDRGFTIQRVDADFFVAVFLNMGNWYARKPNEGVCEPEFYVIPKNEVQKRIDPTRKMPKLFIKEGNPAMLMFRNAWHLVEQFLDIDKKAILTGLPSKQLP